MKKQKNNWCPKGARLISPQIACDDIFLYFRKYKSIEKKIRITSIVAIRTEKNTLHIDYRELQKCRYVPGYLTGTSSIIKTGTLKQISKILNGNDFMQINRNTIVRLGKASRGSSTKTSCAIWCWDQREKRRVIDYKYQVSRKYYKNFKKFLDGKLQRPRKKAGRFYLCTPTSDVGKTLHRK